MSWTLKPITARVAAERALYRDAVPDVCLARYRIITEFYMNNPDLSGILRRAKVMKAIYEQIPVRIGEREVIVGAQSAKYRGGALYPENCVSFIKGEIGSGSIAKRPIDPYGVTDEDKEYINATIDFWLKGESTYAKTQAYYPEEYAPHDFNGVTMMGRMTISDTPVGHFATGYDKAIKEGFRSIKEEADSKQAEIVARGMPGHEINQYNFYRAVSIVSEGMITLTKRYAALAQEMHDAEKNPARKKELALMVETLNWTMENPARNYIEALQCLYMYQTCLCLEANMHGITFGRVDQYLGDFLERDLADGTITEEYAQELLDLFYLKVAEMNKPWGEGPTSSAPGYTSGQMMCMGGVDKDGNDASNKVTYMMLQSAGRLELHDPPQSLRVHKNTPAELWEAALETTRLCGGIPTFENDEVIIEALVKRGLTLEHARNYTPIGCVEPAGNGNDWPACGGTGSGSYINLPNAVLLSINNGFMTPSFPGPDGKITPKQVGPATGYLYEMENFEQVKAAYIEQVEFFIRWHVILNNNAEYSTREVLPLPVVSSTMGGCMEKGMDVMFGGSTYTASGIPGIGIGNVADSLFMIKHLCFDTKKCTTQELFDALQNNWEGYEDLQAYIKNQAPHFGNAIAEVDEIAKWASAEFARIVTGHVCPRGTNYTAAMFPVTAHVIFGKMTRATPDGRSAGMPLADGISPVQQMDTNGPTAVIHSVSQIDQTDFANGTLFNMKFSPSAVRGDEGITKMSQLIQTYFDMGGMEIQINVLSTETLRNAQKRPEDYKNLVVRVAGFSAFFVEMSLEAQEDLIGRTVLEM